MTHLSNIKNDTSWNAMPNNETQNWVFLSYMDLFGDSFFFHCGIGIWREREEIDENNKQVINAESTPSDDIQGLVNVICLPPGVSWRLFISRNYYQLNYKCHNCKRKLVNVNVLFNKAKFNSYINYIFCTHI